MIHIYGNTYLTADKYQFILFDKQKIKKRKKKK